MKRHKLAIVRGVYKTPSAHLPYGSLKSSFNIANQLILSGKFEKIDFYQEKYFEKFSEIISKCKIEQIHFPETGIKDIYDIIYLSGGHFSYDSFALRPNNKIPVVAEVGTVHFPEQWSSIFLASHQGNISNIDGFIFKSTRAKKIFDQTLKDWNLKFHLNLNINSTYISNGVNLIDNKFSENYRNEFRKTLNLKSKSKLFLTFSRLAPNSKVDYESLLFAWKDIADSFPEAILIISGAIITSPDFRQYPTELLKIAKEIGVYKNIRVIANPYDLWPNAHNYLMSGCDIFIHTTRGLEETTSNVVLEALAHSMPIIASNWAGMPDIISEKENGYLIDAWVSKVSSKLSSQIFSRDSMFLNPEFEKYITIDNNQLISKIKELLSDDSLLNEMREKSRESAENLFDIKIKVNERIMFFKKLINKSRKENKSEPLNPLIDMSNLIFNMANNRFKSNTKIVFKTRENLEQLLLAFPKINSQLIVGLFDEMEVKQVICYEDLKNKLVALYTNNEILDETLIKVLFKCNELNMIYLEK